MEIKPCHFCKNPKPQCRGVDTLGKHAYTAVHCFDCGARGPKIEQLHFTGEPAPTRLTDEQARDKAIEQWNGLTADNLRG